MALLSPQIIALAESVVRGAREKKLRLATAESCTGGLVSGALTAVPGSSEVFDQGFITYSYEAKTARLGVPSDVLESRGAVSEEVARAMVEGALAASSADIVIAATGIAGPGGGMPGKPVGLVYVAVMRRGGAARVTKSVFSGDRDAVREQTVRKALELFIEELG